MNETVPGSPSYRIPSRRLLAAVRLRPGLPAALLCVVLLGAAATPAVAQDATLQRLERLERDLRDLQRDYYRGERPDGAVEAQAPATGPRAAQFEIRLQQLESELRKLTGEIERNGFGVDRLEKRFDKLIRDVDLRLTTLEQRPVAPAAQAPVPAAGETPGATGATVAATPPAAAPASPAPAGSSTAAALPDGSPMDRYNHALSLLRRADYVGAEAAFRAFLGEHPDDPLAGNAHYWLGETHYVRNEFEPAARAFLEGFERFPEGNKAPDTLLKLGVTLRQLGQAGEACATFDELNRRFPDASAAIKRRARRERATANCG